MLTRCSKCRQLVTRYHPNQLKTPHRCGGKLERTSWAKIFAPKAGDIVNGQLILPAKRSA